MKLQPQKDTFVSTKEFTMITFKKKIKFAPEQLKLITTILWWVLVSMIINQKESVNLLKYLKN
jgi:hypothetical protein